MKPRGAFVALAVRYRWRQTSPDGHRYQEPVRTSYRPQRFAGPRCRTARRIAANYLQPDSRQPLENRSHCRRFATSPDRFAQRQRARRAAMRRRSEISKKERTGGLVTKVRRLIIWGDE